MSEFNFSSGFDGSSARAKLSTSLIKTSSEFGDLKFLSTSAEAKAGLTGVGMKAGVNLVESEIGGVKARVGLNLDTGGSIDRDGMEVKVGGLGVKVGKVIGASTPFGDVEIDIGKFFRF